ncbi:hypothetical protein M427DRAFT_328284 [Gonapodya prolifera JEL478]|uniref:Uncharacterized protein n=1 Tax=Gonapodya prolifera (strain JEL478) TaxID=1344416 RepID=A0A139AE82_GONPJ|nr:hypothetical protein M427DRAFT_328284 [Gonapodya prolifera JEL478]|eukprot:KXS15068.1 hypothetical protein M427DRAFT_328284 [Gonapodya prolifera JEL478]
MVLKLEEETILSTLTRLQEQAHDSKASQKSRYKYCRQAHSSCVLAEGLTSCMRYSVRSLKCESYLEPINRTDPKRKANVFFDTVSLASNEWEAKPADEIEEGDQAVQDLSVSDEATRIHETVPEGESIHTTGDDARSVKSPCLQGQARDLKNSRKKRCSDCRRAHHACVIPKGFISCLRCTSWSLKCDLYQEPSKGETYFLREGGTTTSKDHTMEKEERESVMQDGKPRSSRKSRVKSSELSGISELEKVAPLINDIASREPKIDGDESDLQEKENIFRLRGENSEIEDCIGVEIP